MAQKEIEQEALITGAGPAGLCAALFLIHQGAQVELIDKRWEGPPHNPAVLLHPDTLALLDSVGVRFDLIREARPVDALAFYEGREREGRILLQGDAVSYAFALVVPMSVLRQKLELRLNAMGAEVHWNHRLASIEAHGASLHTEVDVLGDETLGYGVMHSEKYVRKRLFQAPHFVIGADGPASVVRQQLHLPWESVGEAMTTLVFAVDTNMDIGPELRVTRSREGVVSSVWPLPGVRALRVNMTLPLSSPIAQKAERGETPSEAELLELLRVHVPWFDPAATHTRLVVFETFAPTLASETQEHAYLLGESFHRLFPFASHSLNLSIRRAFELAGMLKRERLGQGEVDGEASHPWRRAAERIAMLSSPTPQTNGAHHAWVLPLIPASGQQYVQAASQLRMDA